MKKVIILIAVLGLFLAGCNHDPGKGVILKRSYDSAWTWYESYCDLYSPATKYSSSHCILSHLVPIHQPATYEFLLQDGDKKGWHDVTLGEYNRYHVGDDYS